MDGNSVHVKKIDILGIRLNSKLNFDSHISILFQRVWHHVSLLQ